MPAEGPSPRLHLLQKWRSSSVDTVLHFPMSHLGCLLSVIEATVVLLGRVVGHLVPIGFHTTGGDGHGVGFQDAETVVISDIPNEELDAFRRSPTKEWESKYAHFYTGVQKSTNAQITDTHLR